MGANREFVYNASVEAIAKRARVATTNEELTTICKQLNVADEIFLGHVDPWLSKNALSTLYRSLKKYPALREDMNYFGTLNGFMRQKEAIFCKINPDASFIIADVFKESTNELVDNCKTNFRGSGLAMAFVVGSGRWKLSGIIINGKSLLQQSILSNLEYGELVGFSPKGCKSVKSLVDHEIGHLLDAKLGINTSHEFRRIMSHCDVSYIHNNLSHYAVMNNVINEHEVIAEAYAEYCNNPNPRPLALGIGGIIDRKYKAAYGKSN